MKKQIDLTPPLSFCLTAERACHGPLMPIGETRGSVIFYKILSLTIYRLSDVCLSGIILLLIFCSSAFAESGTASFYGHGEKLNKHTASGDLFYPSHLTAASYHFPLGSYVNCQSLATGKEITVLINDLGPNKRLGRLIDLSYSAFRLIDNPKKGIAQVNCTEVKP